MLYVLRAGEYVRDLRARISSSSHENKTEAGRCAGKGRSVARQKARGERRRREGEERCAPCLPQLFFSFHLTKFNICMRACVGVGGLGHWREARHGGQGNAWSAKRSFRLHLRLRRKVRIRASEESLSNLIYAIISDLGKKRAQRRERLSPAPFGGRCRCFLSHPMIFSQKSGWQKKGKEETATAFFSISPSQYSSLYSPGISRIRHFFPVRLLALNSL